MKSKTHSIKIGSVELIPMNSNESLASVWDVRWLIKERPDKRKNELKKVGEIWFMGAPERGTLSMDFSIEPEFKMSSVVKEVLRGLIEWSFAHKDIYEISVSTPTGDYYRTDAIERAGFVFRTGDKVEEVYSIVKPKTVWLGLYILIGIVGGFLLGVLFGSFVIGMAIGIVIGVLMGAVLDTKANRSRNDVTGKQD